MKRPSPSPLPSPSGRGIWAIAVFALWLALAPAARAQTRPYIGYTYPAGGQQGTTFQIKLGGQGLTDVNQVLITGAGVTTKVLEYQRRLSGEELALMSEQVNELKKATTAVASAMSAMMTADKMTSENPMMMSAMTPEKSAGGVGKEPAALTLITRIEKRTREYVQTPACVSISALVIAEVTIATNAEPGARELRLATPRGVSNPLVFQVGQLPEFTRKPMLSATLQVLGKEAQSLRKRPPEELEDRITLPCTLNGQIASGEVNRYRFEARQGQRLVIATLGRELIPYIADAVPGWFQPVLALYDAKGKEVAYDDDYRFNPDPTILYEVAQDGEYLLEIHDSIYRGREDFVYRITLGELPFVTSISPLGGRAGSPVTPNMRGWNLKDAELTPIPKDAEPGVHSVAAVRNGFVSNRVPLALDQLPEALEKETNNTQATAQKITLPIVINGRINKPGDWDVFEFTGKSNETIVAEVMARRLDSPLDSVLKLTDAQGTLLAFNDDHEDLGAGVNTHHADSYFMTKLPADGAYYVHIGDTARKGGVAYNYRLRLSAPQPDFELRAAPSSIIFRTNSTAVLAVYARRQDGFAGPIKLALKDPPAGFSAPPVTLAGTQTLARLTINGPVAPTKGSVNLSIVGRAKIGDKAIVHEAVPAEDRMQAFLWRHLVPASELLALVFDPGYRPPPKRVARLRPPAAGATNTVMIGKPGGGTNAVGTNVTVAAAGSTAAKPKFTKQQIAGRLRQLKLLFEEGLLTEDFYCDKVAECETAQ